MNIPFFNKSDNLNSIEYTGKKFIDLPKNIESVNSIGDTKNAQVKKAAEGFEAIFLNMMMKEMKMPLFGDSNNISNNSEFNNFGANTLQSYFSMLFAEQIAKTGNGVGIADLIYKQLTGKELNSNSGTLPNNQVIREKNSDDQPFIDKQQTNALNLNVKQNIENQSPQNEYKVNGDFLNRVQNRLANYQDSISAASQTYRIPKELIQAVITAESAARPNAVSKAGAKGLMQLMDGTARFLDVKDSFDPNQNIQGGSKYLRQMLDRFGNNLQLALAAYNAGPRNVEKYNGIPPFDETQNYVQRVMHYYQYFSNMKEGENT